MDVCPIALSSHLDFDLVRNFGIHAFHSVILQEDPPPDISLPMRAANVMRKSFMKKYHNDEVLVDANTKALELFCAWNTKCAGWVEPVASTSIDAICLGELKQSFLKCFETTNGEVIDFPYLVPRFYSGVGPGASAYVKGCDYLTKVGCSSMTGTEESLFEHYFSSVLHCETELSTELFREANFGHRVVGGSTLGFAPKNHDISRTRCSEPSLNMMYQLGTGQVLEEVLLERFNIDLKTQPDLNRELARLGSINGRFGTADLTSASDAISLGLWDWLMPYREIHDWFRFIRSPLTTYTPRKGAPVVIKLDMLSSMGNGFTFPLMTLLFCCAVEAVYNAYDIPIRYNCAATSSRPAQPGNWGVFGDDIVVVTEAFEPLVRLLTYLGFSVNESKSYNSGCFRESCGGDFYSGYQLRGVYCKRLRAPQHRYALINYINGWSAQHGIALPGTIGLLRRSVWNIQIPPWENGDAGIKVPLSAFMHSLRVDKNRSFIYARFVPDVEGDDPILNMDQKWGPLVNISGVLLTAVQGRMRNGLIYGRVDHVKYKKRLSVAPSWGWCKGCGSDFSAAGWDMFEKIMFRLNWSATQ